MNKSHICMYCGKTLTEETTKIPCGKSFEDYYVCSDNCLKNYDSYRDEVNKNMFKIAGLLPLGFILMIIGAVIQSVIIAPIFIIALGLVLLKFPYVKSQQLERNGIEKSKKDAKLIGKVFIILGLLGFIPFIILAFIK